MLIAQNDFSTTIIYPTLKVKSLPILRTDNLKKVISKLILLACGLRVYNSNMSCIYDTTLLWSYREIREELLHRL